MWRPHESIVALRAAVDFTTTSSLSFAEPNSNQTCEILVGDGPVDLEQRSRLSMDGMGDLKAAADKWHLSFRFLGFQMRANRTSGRPCLQPSMAALFVPMRLKRQLS